MRLTAAQSPRQHHPLGCGGFTLTEMLVVLGVIIVVISIFLPAMMVVRKKSRQAICMSNLGQIGGLYLMYADRNEDYIPLGTSQMKDPTIPGVEPHTPRKEPPMPPVPWEWPSYHTMNNQYFWVKGAPSSAMGPFLMARLITPGGAKIFYCPSVVTSFERIIPRFQAASDGQYVEVIDITYEVRPMHRVWIHDHINHTVEYPTLMPKLNRNSHMAIVAHGAQFATPHGSEQVPIATVLYADGSVRMVFTSTYREALDMYVKMRQPPHPPGYLMSSNIWAINEDDARANTIWQNLDRTN